MTTSSKYVHNFLALDAKTRLYLQDDIVFLLPSYVSRRIIMYGRAVLRDIVNDRYKYISSYKKLGYLVS